jgi:uncharacterized protein (TIGR00730 family)
MEPVRLRKATWTGKEVEDAEAAHGISLSLSLQERLHVVGLMREYVAGITQLAGLASTPTVAIFGSARTAPNSPTYQAACETARLLAEAGFGIITGGGPGIMEAANRGARESGARSIGCPIHLQRAEAANMYVDVAIPFTYFAPRKATLLTAACAFVVFPGGFGTLDELFEVLAAMQTRKMAHVPLVLYGSAFWYGLVDWLRQMLEAEGMIDRADLNLLSLVDEPHDVAIAILTTMNRQCEKKCWHVQQSRKDRAYYMKSS